MNASGKQTTRPAMPEPVALFSFKIAPQQACYYLQLASTVEIPLPQGKDNIAIPNATGITCLVVDCCSMIVTGNNTIIVYILTNRMQ